MGRPARRHRAAPLVQYEVAEPLPYQQGLFVCAGEWLALGRGKTPFQRASHCALLRAIRGWPVGNEGAAPTHFARPDLVTASTTGGSQRLNGECRQPGGACDGGQPRGRGVGSACLARSYLPASFVPRYWPGPLTVSSSPPDSFLSSSVQMAPWAEQSVVAFRTMATSALEPGVTVISQRTFLPGSSRRT